jgi:serine/threonine-protein kinase
MPLLAGTRLGPYEIVCAIGAGGMGEVYRARDTQLGREVAIKVLPESVAHDPDRLGRFEREARLLAALNHPNVAQIYGMHPDPASPALVMELVPGRTLDAILEARGVQGLAPPEALLMARQIAAAVEAAHEAGIVHRDLKPLNIQVRDDGTVKVLDFGLAKALEPAPVPLDREVANLPTRTSPMKTGQGMILGTPAYMAPEQARGLAVDKRADVWAFGCVLLEMLSGGPAFSGTTVSDLLSAVLRDEPDWSRLPPAVGPRVRALLARCLDKDPRQRLRDIGEARIAIDAALAGDEPEAGGPSAHTGHAPWEFAVHLPPGHWLPLDESPVLALARDGRTLVFVGISPEGRRLYRRDMGRVEVAAIAGSEGGEGPFLSPDGRWVGFFVDGWLKKVPIEGGRPTTLCQASTLHRGAAWTGDGRIVFSPLPDSALLVVADSGGTPLALTRIDRERGERSHRWPEMLADGRSLLFTVGTSESAQDYDAGVIAIVSLASGETHVLARGGRMAREASARELFLQRRSTLLVVPRDPDGSRPASGVRTLLEGVAGDASSGSGYFATGGDVLAYAPLASLADRDGLYLVDRSGAAERLPLDAKGYRYPRASPDGGRIAVHVADQNDLDARGTRGDIWVYELSSKRTWRLTMGARSSFPCWSPDGGELSYFRGGNPSGIYVRDTEGVRGEEPLWATPQASVRLPESWHPDGSRLAAYQVGSDLSLWLVQRDGSEPTRAGHNAGEGWGASFSPDGHYLAYTSTESGVAEVFVLAMGPSGVRWQVSTDGGMFPLWSRNGRELLFLQGQMMMSAEVHDGSALQFGTPRALFRCPFDLRTAPTRNHDLLPDGRFVMVGRPPDLSRPVEIRLRLSPLAGET